jgi:uncharacterized protein
MTRCLVDVNVVLALLVPSHGQHGRVMRWFDALAAGEAGLCRFVQLGVVRLLADRAVMSEYAVTVSAGWSLIEELLGDERFEFIVEPSGIGSLIPALLGHRASGPGLVSDVYLAAFALASSHELVTMDKGFRSFRGLEVELL